MDISQARDCVFVAAGAGYNVGGGGQSIKDIRADATGIVEVITEGGNTIPFNVLQSEKLSLQGDIQVTTNTDVAVQVYL